MGYDRTNGIRAADDTFVRWVGLGRWSAWSFPRVRAQYTSPAQLIHAGEVYLPIHRVSPGRDRTIRTPAGETAAHRPVAGSTIRFEAALPWMTGRTA